MQHHAEGRLRRASDRKRLTATQLAKLDALDQVTAAPLTEQEVTALQHAREFLQLHGLRRTTLHDAKDQFGLRWPSWLAEFEAGMSNSSILAPQVSSIMLRIEKAACGLGFSCGNWPDGVGVLLASEVDLLQEQPRLLTLGSDAEKLLREGQRLEHRFGRDIFNGWSYNHPLNKFREYQESLLRTAVHPPEIPNAMSIRQLEGGWRSRFLLVRCCARLFLAMKRANRRPQLLVTLSILNRAGIHEEDLRKRICVQAMIW